VAPELKVAQALAVRQEFAESAGLQDYKVIQVRPAQLDFAELLEQLG
jgi:hypothetical protein